MSKPRVWIVLSFILVFAAGVVAGVFGHNWLATQKPGDRRPPTMDNWAKEIGLSADQQARLKDLFKANDLRWRSDARLKELKIETSKRFGELRRQFQAEIDAVLTPEQKVKNDAMIKRHEEERRKANSSSRRNQPRSSGSGNEGHGGGSAPAPQRGPEPPDSDDMRTDNQLPFQEYYF
jgi:Spy/CpxP family protein refolding chaperone